MNPFGKARLGLDRCSHNYSPSRIERELTGKLCQGPISLCQTRCSLQHQHTAGAAVNV